jgi:ATP-dependent RNA circularization protein (DNA/RNA ligase family)
MGVLVHRKVQNEMPRNLADQQPSLPQTLRRQIRTEANARYLQSLPGFRVDPDLPEELREILERLDLESREGGHG